METQSIAKNLVYQRKLKGFSQEELLEVAIKDIYTPYEWQNYFPYNTK